MRTASASVFVFLVVLAAGCQGESADGHASPTAVASTPSPTSTRAVATPTATTVASTSTPVPPTAAPTRLAPTPASAGGSDSSGDSGRAGCDRAYPTICIPPPPPDLDCGEIPSRRFKVVAPDPHGFDRDHDGVGCES